MKYFLFAAWVLFAGCAAKPKNSGTVSAKYSPATVSIVKRPVKVLDTAFAARAAATRTAAIKKLTSKALADSLRIVAHTPCAITEIPKPRHRGHGCPVGCTKIIKRHNRP